MGTDATRRTTRWRQASKSGGLRNAARAGLLCAIAALMEVSGVSAGERRPLPHAGEHDHLGVATCASSTCHGSAEPLDAAPVLQNEYLTWHRRDAHAESYETLLDDQSKRIAERLGIGAPERADTCLDCHADNVAEDRRGERFQIEDGIGCEACHGGAEEWIKTHASGEATHADNLERGMYPTNRPGARARLCLSCHYRHPDSPMNHRLMAAGHPQLQFELSTFSRIQPPHYRVDADYRERKRAPTAAQTWAVGEIMAARKQLKAIRDDLYHGGTFPELYFFDCKACHHDLDDPDWVASNANGNRLGSVPLEDATLRVVGLMLTPVAPELADEWRTRLDALQAATSQSPRKLRRAADQLHQLTRPVRGELGETELDGQRVVAAMREIVEAGTNADFRDRTWADQATMALASLLTTAEERSVLGPQRIAELEKGLDALYGVLDEPSAYSRQDYRETLKTFGQRLP